MSNPSTIQVLLSLRMEPNDAGARTVKEYLMTLLKTVLIEEEGFSGKRPFGNSSWMFTLYKPMIQAELIDGGIDGDGYISRLSREEEAKGKRMLLDAVDSL